MEILIREMRPARSGPDESHDAEISSELITIGSAPDQSIQLLGQSVAPEHAECRLVGGRLAISCQRGATIVIGDRETSTASVDVGDTFLIGGNRLEVIDAPPGFDAALQIYPDRDVDRGIFESAFRTDLSDLRVSTRALAWTVSLVVALGFFVLPLVYATSGYPALQTIAWLPTDALWSSGPLSPAHTVAAGDDCSLCHSKLFGRARDADCAACHLDVYDHVAQAAASADVHGVDTPRCATCHREHDEPEPTLLTFDGDLCTDCHADLDEGATGLAAVTGFSLADHPGFSVSLLKPVSAALGTGLSFGWTVSREQAGSAAEQSNLTFPHETHLDAERVEDLRTGSGLGCADCHELQQDREHFVPVAMASHCVDCHELSFDTTMPSRQLPHGEPLEVMMTLEGHYLRQFSDPDVPQESVARRRIPDRDNGSTDCTGTAFGCAADAAAAEIRQQFTVKGCVSCHLISEQSDVEIYSRFQVHPVRLTTDFYANASFDHGAHSFINDRGGDDACLHCHEADTSTESSDLLMPTIETCLECHSGTPTADRLTTQCDACHSYHPFSPAATLSSESDP